MIFFELILSALAWSVQIGVILLIAMVIGFAAAAAEQKLRKRSLKRWPRILITFLLLCAVLAALAVNPPVVRSETVESELTEELCGKIRGGVSGLYSWKIPLVPVCAEITGWERCVIDGKPEYIVEFSVYYFCLGTQKMEYSTHDGYNADPMFGQ